MKNKTKEIKKLLGNATSLEEKIAILKDGYKDQPCYILTAGPSINDIDKKKLVNFLHDKLVISVKQTIDLLDGIADFHLINEYNYQRYDISDDTVRIKLKTSKKLITPGYNPDIEFNIDKKMLDSNQILAETMEFDKYTFDKQLERPLGSGIMYELGIYLPLLFGVNEMYLVGWDIGNINDDQINRFYENKGWAKNFERALIAKSSFLYNHIFTRIRNLYKYTLFLLLKKNVTINVPGIRDSESRIIAKSTEPLYDWLESRGVKAYVVSDRSMCSEKFTRVELSS